MREWSEFPKREAASWFPRHARSGDAKFTQARADSRNQAAARHVPRPKNSCEVFGCDPPSHPSRTSPHAVVSAVYQIAAVNPVTGGRARRRKTAGDRREKSGGSLIAAGNDGGRGVCSSLEVSKNFKFSYSSRACIPGSPARSLPSTVCERRELMAG